MVTLTQRWRLLYGGPALMWIQVFFLIDAFGRGVDYSYPPGTSALTLKTVEQAAPIQWWGIALVFCTLMVVAAQLAHWPRIAVVGEVCLGALIVALGGALFAAVLDRPWWEGFRTGLTLMCVGATHIVIAYALVRANSLWGWSNASTPR